MVMAAQTSIPAYKTSFLSIYLHGGGCDLKKKKKVWKGSLGQWRAYIEKKADKRCFKDIKNAVYMPTNHT